MISSPDSVVSEAYANVALKVVNKLKELAAQQQPHIEYNL